MKFEPMYDNIIVKPKKQQEKTAGGIFIPEPETSTPYSEGIVVAVGPGRIAKASYVLESEDGYEIDDVIPLRVKIGDHVIYRKMTEIPIKDDSGEEFMLLSEGTVLAIKRD